MADEFADITLTCRRCGAPFLFERHDRRFYDRVGHAPPKNCPACRTIKHVGAERAERSAVVDPFAAFDARRQQFAKHRRRKGVR